MKLSQMLRKVAMLGLCSVTFSAVADAQPPRGEGGGGQPPQEGGRGDRQGRGGGRGGFGGGFGGGMMGGMGGMMARTVDRATLLGSDKVRQELKIEEAQAATIDAALDAYREERNNAPRPDRDAFQNMSEEERTKYFADMQKQREELSKKTDTVLNALLEEGQIKRLDQITVQARLQMAALQTLMADDMKAALTITEEQVGKLKEVETKATEDMQKMMEEMRANFQPGGGAPGGGGPGAGFEGMREKMETARKAVTESAMAVLTDAQKSKLEEMKGAAFELDPRSLMGGRGGFGGGGPGGQGGPGGGQGGRGGRGQGGGRGGRPAE